MLHREPEETPQPPRRRRFRRRNLLRTLALILLVLALTLRGAAVAWTDFLWFSSLGLSSVWTTLVFTRILIILIATVVAFLVLYINLRVADKLSPRGAAFGSQDELVARLEYAYRHREEIKKIGIKAGQDLQNFTWENSAQQVIDLLQL